MLHGGLHLFPREQLGKPFLQQASRDRSPPHSLWSGRGAIVPAIQAHRLGNHVDERKGDPQLRDLGIRQATRLGQGRGEVIDL